MVKKKTFLHSTLSSQNFLFWALCLIRSPLKVLSLPKRRLLQTLYFFCLRLERLGLISQAFSPPWTSPGVLGRLFPEALLFCSQLFVVIRKIYCFNTHTCKCLYLQRTSGRWHHTPGMSGTGQTWQQWTDKWLEVDRRRRCVSSKTPLCRFTGKWTRDMQSNYCILQRWQCLMMPLFITLCVFPWQKNPHLLGDLLSLSLSKYFVK